ncbi:hypothetical protein [Streptomyces sp. NBC_00233]|uniref:hypothetical protein n=1 Tax=Streptomyces sp. NBC_00233 TaxID=2975686 RepID=UPI002251A2D0|nr:hypothetical protein [Streptomyces sp. NBC_00233]MCX5233407.1 hypothetical protein [Streptomyces sp. NBC_00233]
MRKMVLACAMATLAAGIAFAPAASAGIIMPGVTAASCTIEVTSAETPQMVAQKLVDGYAGGSCPDSFVLRFNGATGEVPGTPGAVIPAGQMSSMTAVIAAISPLNTVDEIKTSLIAVGHAF